jgi:hypothetical protein
MLELTGVIMFLWNASFDETPGFQAPGLLLRRLEALSQHQVMCFAGACILHAADIFVSLERDERYVPYHSNLISLVSQAGRMCFHSASAAADKAMLSALESQALTMIQEDPRRARKKCNEDSFLSGTLCALRCAMGVDTEKNAAYAARYAYSAVCSWFMAVNPGTPKTLKGTAAILAAERGVSECIEEIKYQERCLGALESCPGKSLPTEADLLGI